MNQNEASSVLIAQIDEAVDRIRQGDAPAKCAAHRDLANGVEILLLCAKAQLETGKDTARNAGVISAVVSGLMIGASELMGKLFR